MSWILAIETSTEWCSVALARFATDGQIVACRFRHEHTGPRSSGRVLPAAGELLAEAGIKLADCAAIAFGAGPGSFTGLRTACGVAQGLAFGAELPVIPVNTLMACAERLHTGSADSALPPGVPVLVALDARMDEVYAGAFLWDEAAGEWASVTPLQVCKPEAVTMPESADGRFWLAGNAAAVFGDRLAAAGRALDSAPDAMPHAAAVAGIAARAFVRGEGLPADQAMPIYLRDKVAQTIVERQAVAAERASLAAGAAANAVGAAPKATPAPTPVPGHTAGDSR